MSRRIIDLAQSGTSEMIDVIITYWERNKRAAANQIHELKGTIQTEFQILNMTAGSVSADRLKALAAGPLFDVQATTVRALYCGYGVDGF